MLRYTHCAHQRETGLCNLHDSDASTHYVSTYMRLLHCRWLDAHNDDGRGMHMTMSSERGRMGERSPMKQQQLSPDLDSNSKTNAENGSLARVTRSRASSNYLLQINASSFGKSLIASNASRRGITIWREHCPAPRRTPLAASSLCWDVDRWQFVHSDLLFQDRWKLWPVTSFAGSLMIFNASRLLHDVLCCLHGGWQSFLASWGDRASE